MEQMPSRNLAHMIDLVRDERLMEIALSDGEVFTFIYQSGEGDLAVRALTEKMPISSCEWTTQLIREKRPIKQTIQMKNNHQTFLIEARFLHEEQNETITIVRRLTEKQHAITIKQAERWLPLSYQDVIYLEAHDRKTHVVSQGKKRGIHRNNLKELENELPTAQFVRCHRSYIINMEHVKEIHPDSHATLILVMSNDERIPVSQNFTRLIRNRFGF